MHGKTFCRDWYPVNLSFLNNCNLLQLFCFWLLSTRDFFLFLISEVTFYLRGLFVKELFGNSKVIDGKIQANLRNANIFAVFFFGFSTDFLNSAVELLCNEQHRDLKKMSVVERWPLRIGFAQIGTFTLNTWS